MDFANFNWYLYVAIPSLIFIARIFDVSIGTIRLIFISKGYRFLAPVLGFFEVLIWLAAIQQIILNLSNVFSYIAYALGFATCTYVGIVIEERISIGKVIVRVITRKDAKSLLKNLKRARYTATTIGADGPDGKVKLIISVVDRDSLHKFISILKKFDPHTAYSIEDVRYAYEKDIPAAKGHKISGFFGSFRKSK